MYRPLLRTIYETVLASVVFYAEDSQEGVFWEGQEAAQHTRGGLMLTDILAVHFMVLFEFHSFTYV